MNSCLTPVIIGVSQFTKTKDESSQLHRVGLMKVVFLDTINDTGTQKNNIAYRHYTSGQYFLLYL